MLGSVSKQPLITRWSENARLRVDGGRLRVAVTSPVDRVYTVLDPNAQQERERIDQLLVQQGDNLAAMISVLALVDLDESPSAIPARWTRLIALLRHVKINIKG